MAKKDNVRCTYCLNKLTLLNSKETATWKGEQKIHLEACGIASHLSGFRRFHFTCEKMGIEAQAHTVQQSHVCVISTCLAQTSLSRNVIKENAFDKPSVLPLAPRDDNSPLSRMSSSCYNWWCRLVARATSQNDSNICNFSHNGPFTCPWRGDIKMERALWLKGNLGAPSGHKHAHRELTVCRKRRECARKIEHSLN